MYFHRLPKLRFILLVILLGHYAIFLSSVEAIVFVIAPPANSTWMRGVVRQFSNARRVAWTPLPDTSPLPSACGQAHVHRAWIAVPGAIKLIEIQATRPNLAELARAKVLRRKRIGERSTSWPWAYLCCRWRSRSQISSRFLTISSVCWDWEHRSSVLSAREAAASSNGKTSRRFCSAGHLWYPAPSICETPGQMW